MKETKIYEERILKAAENCLQVKDVLQIIFPEIFEGSDLVEVHTGDKFIWIDNLGRKQDYLLAVYASNSYIIIGIDNGCRLVDKYQLEYKLGFVIKENKLYMSKTKMREMNLELNPEYRR